MPEYGYAGEILKVDLSSGKIAKLPSKDYTERFIGGQGVMARLYWEMVPPEAKASDPENCLIAASGPVAGFPGFAGSRWKLGAKTALREPESFSYGNLGERWGSVLKFAGYDCLAVQGLADRLSYLYIHDGKAEIRDAARLKGLSTFDTIDALQAELGKDASVLATGPAGENRVPFAMALAEGNTIGTGGTGAVMGSKNLKAIAVAGDKRPVAARPEKVRELIGIIRKGSIGAPPPPRLWEVPGLTHNHACYGCGIGCSREMYRGEGGRRYKSLCQSSNVYVNHAVRYNGSNDERRLLATRLCDGYGLDTIVIESTIDFLYLCYKEGVLDEKKTGLPLSKIGGTEFIEELTRVIAMKEGFGAVLAGGVIAAAKEIGPEAEDLVHLCVATGCSEKKDYDPRLLITSALFYATEPRRSISDLHEISSMPMAWLGMGPGAEPGKFFSADSFRRVAEKVWGSAMAADFSTYEGKALAAKMIQDRVFFKESLVVCDLRWTLSLPSRILGTTPDTVTEAQVYSAITGREIDCAEMSILGERIFNLQRAVFLRQGWGGRKGDTILDYFFTEPIKENEVFFNEKGLVPGKDGEVLCRLGTTLDREKFEEMKTEYYGHRGWDAATGYPRKKKLHELGLDDVADDLEGRGLVG